MLVLLRVALAASLSLCGSVAAQQPETVPKTIEDILVQLKSIKPDEAVLAQAAATLASEPPAGADRATLAKFYLARSLANRTGGTLEQMLQDTRKAAELARGMNNSLEWDSLIDLSAAEVLGGNYLNGIKARDEMSRAFVYRGAKYSTSAYAAAACLRADIGDVDRADQALRSAETILSQLPRYQDLSFWVGQIERCRARVLRAKGKYTEAETTLRVAISNSDKAINNIQGLQEVVWVIVECFRVRGACK